MQRIIIAIIKKYSIPVFRSVFKAYKDTTAKAGAQQSSSDDGKKKHPFDQFFSSMMSKTNMSAPPIDEGTALQILSIESAQNLQAKVVLERYYTLFKKNDPEIGGTTYLQSKVFAAKECLMEKYQNASELEHEFYKQVVQPLEREEKGEEQKVEEEGDKEEADKSSKKQDDKPKDTKSQK